MLEAILPIALFLSTIFTIILLMLPSRYVKASFAEEHKRTGAKTSVQVLVLGDIGRSPRMQYHAISIAKHGGKVDVIGYQESALHPDLVGNPRVNIVPLPPPPPLLHLNKLPFVIAGPLKVIWQILSLLYVLSYRIRPARWLLVQNPPSIPTLLIAATVCFLRNTHLIIDWHNYGWTILAGTRGASHPFVKISRLYERKVGSWAPTASFTVTDAMKKHLQEKPYTVRSPILTLHDRPASIFQPITDADKRKDFLEHLTETKPFASSILDGTTKLLVSSTSWTPDEDFNLLLEALCSYSTASTTTHTLLPAILAIITGKGPQKAHYLSMIDQLVKTGKLSNIHIKTAWLSTEDYATLLACADLGVCLHMSSSGVDLPMKVVDMFGAGLPVVGYAGYTSWSELVKENENGRGFITSEELSQALRELLGETTAQTLRRLRQGAIKEGSRRWDEEWDGVAGRLLGLCD